MKALLSYYEQPLADEGIITMPRLVRTEFLSGYPYKELVRYIAAQKDRTGHPYVQDDDDDEVFVSAVGHIKIDRYSRNVPRLVLKEKVSHVSLDSRKSVENQKNLTQRESGVSAATGTPVFFTSKMFYDFVHLMMRTLSTAFHPKENEFKDYYTYIPNYQLEVIKSTVENLKIKSFMDLGSGVPIISAFLNLVLEIKTGAVEVRQEIYDRCGAAFSRYVDFYCTDMFRCSSEFLYPWEAIYMYVPIYNQELMLKFIVHLVQNSRKGQYLLLVGFSSECIDYIMNSGLFLRLRITEGLFVFQKIK